MPKKLLLFTLVTALFAFFTNIGSFQLIFEEPRRALVALEMMLSKNYWVPTTNGYLYYNKPPLYNWVLIPFLKIFGTAEWVVRLPNILSLLATALIHYRLAGKYIGKSAALLSALFYLCSADILFFFSFIGEIDLFYALLIHLQVFLIFHFYQKKQIHWLYLSSYLLTAAGCLTKGIPSLPFQALTLLVIFILNKDYKGLFSSWHAAGIALLAILCGGYFYIYSFYHDPFPYLARLYTETFSRSSMENSWLVNLRHLLVGFPVMLIKLCAPWVLFVPLLFTQGFRASYKSTLFLRFCFWFVLVNATVYWLSPGTRERYLYMFLPFIFSMLAVAILGMAKSKWPGIFYTGTAILCTLGLIGLAVFSVTRSGYVTAGICVGLALFPAAIAARQRRPSLLPLFLYSIAFLFLLRTGFDLVILPTRKQDEPYRESARQVAEISRGQKVYLTGQPEKKVDAVSFAGTTIATYTRKEPASLGFQTSYYLGAIKKDIIRYTENTRAPGFYIAPAGWQPAGLQEVKRFSRHSDQSAYLYWLYVKQ